MQDKIHAIKIVGLIIAALAAYFIFQALLSPESFGEWGHYRKDAVADELAREPVHQNGTVCMECHDDISDVHGKDVHYKLECSVCHGDGHKHVTFNLGETTEKISEEEARMPKDYTLEGCLYCHRKLSARPADFPQIDVARHFRLVGVTETQTACIACHSPHEPLFLNRDVAGARIHPIIKECRQCHDPVPAEDHRTVKDHPVIFACSDCHAALVKDFKTRSHTAARCTICHQAHPENENSERIFKNADSRFCLLCHEKKPFKNPDYPPKIKPAEHADDMGVDIKKLVCVNCHMKNIHQTGMTTGLEEGKND
ncbi:MAG: hypothetical protein GY950_20645 [bacterium]|nr:hypothetical protein [bacterium]